MLKTNPTTKPSKASLEPVRRLLSDPLKVLRDLDKLDAEESLLSFVQLMWTALEPGRKFVGGWVIDAIADHLEAVASGQIKRLLINVPPGCSKSLLTNVFFPAWMWGPRNRPEMRFITASYAEKLTVRDNRRARIVMQSRLFQQNWGDRFRFSGDQNAKVRFDNDHLGFKIATSVGGVAMGERGDVFLLDDPNPTRDVDSKVKMESVLQFFTEVVPTRINDPDKSIIIVIQQRTHERDVSGFILSKGLGYEHLCIPMRFETDHPFLHTTGIGWSDPRKVDGELAWPERFSEEYLKGTLEPELSSWGGDFSIAGQLQQRPSPRGGGLFKAKDFQYADSVPAGARRVRGWDLAASTDKRSSWTVGVKLAFAGGKVFVEDVARLQGSPYEVEQTILRCAKADGYAVIQDIPQDPGQAGRAQVSALGSLLHGYTVQFSPETGEKEDRARPFAAQVAAGNVFLVRNSTWNDVFVDEATSFPASQWKDQIDAASRAYAKLLLISRAQNPPVGMRTFTAED